MPFMCWVYLAQHLSLSFKFWHLVFIILKDVHEKQREKENEHFSIFFINEYVLLGKRIK
jgi:hypothetical protein